MNSFGDAPASTRKVRSVMGSSRDDFIKYPRTPHLFGSEGNDDDKHLDEAESDRFIADESLIVEEKIDGTNVGIHFTSAGEMVLQCRGHLITEGMHPQYAIVDRVPGIDPFSEEDEPIFQPLFKGEAFDRRPSWPGQASNPGLGRWPTANKRKPSQGNGL